MVFKRYYNNVIATADAFTDDGWFKTGDKGSIDIDGVLVLSGRTKDSLIVNGVKYFSHELEGAIEDANISGISPSYVAVFSVFPEGNDSEEIVVVFLPTAAMLAWNDAFVETISQISQTSMLYCSKRPLECIPLPIECLPKSALGKLSRSKLKAAYETGVFDQYRVEAKRRIYAVANSVRVAPTTATQVKIAELFSEEFGVDIKEVSTHDSLADMGIDSIQIIRFKKRLEQKLGFETQIPMISLLRNPSIEGIASELWKLGEDFTGAYEPVIELQSAPLKEARPPIFFIHPGVGEILVFLNLAKYFNDRAVYAIRAPGFNPGEEMFESLDEMTTFVSPSDSLIDPLLAHTSSVLM
jgi:acyl carrier protein